MPHRQQSQPPVCVRRREYISIIAKFSTGPKTSAYRDASVYREQPTSQNSREPECVLRREYIERTGEFSKGPKTGGDPKM
jgi:hypothetical protein